MANIIKPKRSNTAAKVPTTTELISGELGVNMADRKIYINNGAAVVQVGAGNLIGLEDVAITSPVNGQSLAYNSTTTKWENSAAGAGDVVGPASATDNALARFDGTTGKLIQNSVATLTDAGAMDVPNITVDYTQYDTAATVTNAVGRMSWDNGNGSLSLGLKNGNVELKLGEQEYVYCFNDTGVAITKGQVVYINGAQGNRVSVLLAIATSDMTSGTTIGLVAESIAIGAEGWVQISGPIYKMNTTGLTAGAPIYLSPTVAGAYTTTKPVAPQHLVTLGFVSRVDNIVGSVFIKVDNGYELDELHNVLITTPVNGNTLVYDAVTGVWENASLTAGSGVSITNGAGSITIANTGVLSLTGTANEIDVSASTGAVTLSLPATINANTTGTAANVTGIVSVLNGGTGQTTYTNGQLLIGNTTGNTLTKATLTAGSGISVTNAEGGITIANTAPDQTVALTGAGATSITGTYPNFTISSVNTTYGTATSTVPGLIELGSDTAQTVAANSVSATASRSYALQLNASGQGVTNVPWTDTVYSLPAATSTVLGGIELNSDTTQTVAANTVSATASRTYGLQTNAAGQGVVNVPWTDTVYSLPAATTTVLGGIELGSDTQQTVAANAVSATASRSYALQVNAAGQGVVNVPWVDTNSGGTVTSVGGTGTVSGLSLSGTVTTTGNLTLGGTLSVTPSNFASQTANTVLAAPNGVAGVPTFRAIVAADIPTLNQNTTGTASNVTGTVAIANGGTGATTRQDAIDALAGAVTSGSYLRGNGTDVVMSTIQAADVPTLNQNTTGTASNVTGTVAIGNGGTGSTTAAAALTALGAYAASNPSGYTSNTGTVTNVATGTGLSGGPITSTGTISLANTTVTAGSYTNASVTVDAQGRITAASSGTSGGVTSFNTRTGAVTLSSADVTTALTYTPYNSTNPSGYITSSGTAANVSGTVAVANGGTGATTAAQARTNLGAGTGNGTVTSVGGTGSYGGLTLSGTVTTSGNLTLGGTPTGTWPISISGGLTATQPNLGYSISGQNIDYGGQGGPQIMSQGSGAAMMSFHRPGAYAINFGLGTDNQLRTGGWSRGGNYVILDENNCPPYVRSSMAGSSTGAVGTFAFLQSSINTGTFIPDTNYSGITLWYTARAGEGATYTVGGTWKCCGYSSNRDRGTVFLRVA